MRRSTQRSRITRPKGRPRHRPGIEALEARSLLTTLTVTTTGDSGPGSLRQAILDSNSTAGVQDTIRFDIPAADPGLDPATGAWTIRPVTPLPEITDPAVIDGTTQPGFDPTNHRPVIALDGGNQRFDALAISAGDTTVRGLDIGGFLSAVHLKTRGGDVIEGNFIGTDPTGLVARGNSGFGSNLQTGGILIESAGNLVGGTTPAARNLISANDYGVHVVGPAATGNAILGNIIGLNLAGTAKLSNGSGVRILGAGSNTVGGSAAGAGNVLSGNNAYGVQVHVSLTPADGNVIQGNLAGTDPTGTVALGNGISGIEVVASHTQVVGNLVSGNATFGIHVNGGDAIAGEVHDNIIRGNTIGTDLAGTAALPNRVDGLRIIFAHANLIGGTGPGDGNLISGNGGSGIFMQVDLTPGNVFQGNSIGTDRSGTRPLGNGGYGISLNAPGTTVGGTDPGAGNVIAANGRDGLIISLSAPPGVIPSAHSIIQGNFIGTDRSGTIHLGNGGDGLHVDASDNLIGGTAAGAGNVIAYNAGRGVVIPGGVRTSLLSDAIFANGGIGIDVGPFDGPTPNDARGHTGPNLNQNYPVLTSVTSAGGTSTIVGMLDSTPNMSFTVQFFRNDEPDPSSFGEGEVFIGQQTVTTDASGHAAFSATLPVAVTPSQFVTATATDAEGNTSEFSKLVTELAVTETGPEDPAAVGQELVFTIHVTNAGPFPTFNARLTDPLPAGTTFISATGAATPVDGVLTVPIGTLPVGESRTITVHLRADVQGRVVNNVAVQNVVSDSDPTDNEATADAVVDRPAQADLALVVAATPDPGTVGRDVTFTVTISNHGPSRATSVRLTDLLPVGAALVGRPTTSQGTVSRSGGSLVADLGDLDADGVATLTFVVTPTAPGLLTTTGDVTAAEPGTHPSATKSVAIAAPPAPTADLAVTATVTPDGATPSQPLTYVITVANAGPTAATGVVVLTTLPPSFRGVALAMGGLGHGDVGADNVVRVDFGSLGPGARETFRITAIPSTSGRFVVTATASAAEADPNPANNRATVTSMVVAPPPVIDPPPVVDPSPAVDPPPATDGPRVLRLLRYGYHAMPTTLVLTFNQPLDPVTAGDVHNYRIVGPHGHHIPILRAVYDAAQRTVTLHPAQRLSVHRAYGITVIGTGPKGLTNVHGLPLNAPDGGRPGADDHLKLTWRELVLGHVSHAFLIRYHILRSTPRAESR